MLLVTLMSSRKLLTKRLGNEEFINEFLSICPKNTKNEIKEKNDLLKNKKNFIKYI